MATTIAAISPADPGHSGLSPTLSGAGVTTTPPGTAAVVAELTLTQAWTREQAPCVASSGSY